MMILFGTDVTEKVGN